jgi:hypothetical protein
MYHLHYLGEVLTPQVAAKSRPLLWSSFRIHVRPEPWRGASPYRIRGRAGRAPTANMSAPEGAEGPAFALILSGEGLPGPPRRHCRAFML